MIHDREDAAPDAPAATSRMDGRSVAASLMLMVSVLAVLQGLTEVLTAIKGHDGGACARVSGVAQASWLRWPIWAAAAARRYKEEGRWRNHHPSELPPAAQPALLAQLWVEGRLGPITPTWAEVPALSSGTRFTVAANSSHAGRLRVYVLNAQGQVIMPPVLDADVEPGEDVQTPWLRLDGPRGLERLCVALLDSAGEAQSARELPMWHL